MCIRDRFKLAPTSEETLYQRLAKNEVVNKRIVFLEAGQKLGDEIIHLRQIRDGACQIWHYDVMLHARRRNNATKNKCRFRSSAGVGGRWGSLSGTRPSTRRPPR